MAMVTLTRAIEQTRVS